MISMNLDNTIVTKIATSSLLLVGGLFLICNNLPVANASETYSYQTQWGSHGENDSQFSTIGGVVVNSLGNVYVVDVNNNRIQEFTSDGKFITKWGSYGKADGQFNLPTNIAVDASDNVYVTDQFNNRVEKFDANGKFITEVVINSFFPYGIHC